MKPLALSLRQTASFAIAQDLVALLLVLRRLTISNRLFNNHKKASARGPFLMVRDTVQLSD